MKWSDYAHELHEDFNLDVESLSKFLNSQDEIWTPQFTKNFIQQEYGKNIPLASPLIVLPKNVAHLGFQELRICEYAGWTPKFYVSSSTPSLKKIFLQLNMFKIFWKESIPSMTDLPRWSP